jgi:hypothetical protein
MRLVAGIALMARGIAVLRTGPTTDIAVLEVLAIVGGMLLLPACGRPFQDCSWQS